MYKLKFCFVHCAIKLFSFPNDLCYVVLLFMMLILYFLAVSHWKPHKLSKFLVVKTWKSGLVVSDTYTWWRTWELTSCFISAHLQAWTGPETISGKWKITSSCISHVSRRLTCSTTQWKTLTWRSCNQIAPLGKQHLAEDSRPSLMKMMISTTSLREDHRWTLDRVQWIPSPGTKILFTYHLHAFHMGFTCTVSGLYSQMLCTWVRTITILF